MEPTQGANAPFNPINIDPGTNPFLKCKYDGRVRTDLATREMIQAHMRATKSKLMYIDYGNVDGRYEDCEHRPFHMEAIKRFDARIMISKDVIFY